MNVSESLSRTNAGAPPDLDIDGLTYSIFKSFSVIEPWHQGEKYIHHPLVAAMVDQIVRQADDYFLAIAESVEAVNAGWTFASDAVAFYDYLSSGMHSVQELESFRTSMLATASEAERRAKSTAQSFRKVRRELYKISSAIPKDLIKMQKQTRSPVQNGLNTYVAIIPSPLQHRALLGAAVGNNDNPLETERSNQMLTLAKVMTQLEAAQQDLDQLIRQIGRFVDWWNSVKIGIISLQSTMPQLALGKSNPSRTLDHWVAVQQQFMTYSSRIALIEDYFPSLSSPRKVAASSGRPVTSLRQVAYYSPSY
jgi:hypothetical protein